MASITIQNLDKETVVKLQKKATTNGRSVEEEAKAILTSALSKEVEQSDNLAESINNRFTPYGGVELPVITRKIKDKESSP